MELELTDRLRKMTLIEIATFAKNAELAMTEFCIRVERGDVRSKRTYSKFCELLGRTPHQ